MSSFHLFLIISRIKNGAMHVVPGRERGARVGPEKNTWPIITDRWPLFIDPSGHSSPIHNVTVFWHLKEIHQEMKNHT